MDHLSETAGSRLLTRVKTRHPKKETNHAKVNLPEQSQYYAAARRRMRNQVVSENLASPLMLQYGRWSTYEKNSSHLVDIIKTKSLAYRRQREFDRIDAETRQKFELNSEPRPPRFERILAKLRAKTAWHDIVPPHQKEYTPALVHPSPRPEDTVDHAAIRSQLEDCRRVLEEYNSQIKADPKRLAFHFEYQRRLGPAFSTLTPVSCLSSENFLKKNF